MRKRWMNSSASETRTAWMISPTFSRASSSSVRKKSSRDGGLAIGVTLGYIFFKAYLRFGCSGPRSYAGLISTMLDPLTPTIYETLDEATAFTRITEHISSVGSIVGVNGSSMVVRHPQIKG